MLLCPVKLKCGQLEHIARYSLLDTGAGVCHMTYRMWLDMRLHELCWNNNQSLCRLMGMNTSDEMDFDTLPLVSTTSILGDGSEAKVYEIKIDKLQLGISKLGFNNCIELENLTVRLINHDRTSFIIGWNVLKYLDIHYSPSLSDPCCQLTLTDEGLKLFHHERQNKIANFMQSMFNYLQTPADSLEGAF